MSSTQSFQLKTTRENRNRFLHSFFMESMIGLRAKTLDEAAIKSSKMGEAYLVTIDQVTPQSKLKPLSTSSVVAIYDFIEFPKDYKDPLKKIILWGKEWDNSLLIDQGARRYVAHTQMYYAVDGKLIERNKEKEK